ncbi:MAG TPA: hypothetical protein VJ761_26050 [Ktedonobacteraceae bacterium]|nr:hypothetical protein [Ktedonobacteraceae bacterium]
MVNATTAWAVGNNNGQTITEAWDGTRWQLVASPNSRPYKPNFLNSIAAVAPDDLWAVGYYNAGFDRTLIEHWDGSQWSIVPSPNIKGTSNRLNAVTALSASDVWAAGYYGVSTSQTLVEHYDGTSWSIIASPNKGNQINLLHGVAADAPDDIYAVGAYENSGEGNNYRTLILHYDGTGWSVIPSPDQGMGGNWLRSITVIGGTTSFLAAGYYENGGFTNTLLEQWDGSRWSIVPSPNAGAYNNQLYGITAPDMSNLWAVGSYSATNGGIQTLTEHYDGAAWSIVSSPNDGLYEDDLYAVAAYTGGTVWAVGDNWTKQIGNPQALIEFYC